MPRKPLGDKPLTNAERQARHRAAITSQRPTDAAAPSAGAMPSPNSSSCKVSTRNGSRLCPKTFKRALPVKHCR